MERRLQASNLYNGKGLKTPALLHQKKELNGVTNSLKESASNYLKIKQRRPSMSFCNLLKDEWGILTKCTGARVQQERWCMQASQHLFPKLIYGRVAYAPGQPCRFGVIAMHTIS